MTAAFNGAAAVALLALVMGTAIYPYLGSRQRRLDAPESDGYAFGWWAIEVDGQVAEAWLDLDPPTWEWPLDPDLDRTGRAGAAHRWFSPRVPDWGTPAIIALLSAGYGYPFAGFMGDVLLSMDLGMRQLIYAVRHADADGIADTLGMSRGAPGESDESLRERVRDVMKAVPYER